MHPQVAATDPGTPAILLPTNVAALIAIGPGVIWEIVIKSVNSVIVSQPSLRHYLFPDQRHRRIATAKAEQSNLKKA